MDIASIERTTSDVGALVHENYVNEVQPWLEMMDPIAALFEEIGPKGYTLIGEKLQIAADATYSGGFMGTDGYLPDHQYVEPVELNTTPARLYIRRAVDNYLRALSVKPGAYEDFFARIQRQMVDAVKRGTCFHIHGSTAATVATFVSRTDADTLVVDAGYGHAGTAPAMFIEPGMVLALLDAGTSYNTIGCAVVDSVTYNTSSTTATVNFTSDIDTSSTGADGDPLVFATHATEADTRWSSERNNAPLGLIDFFDPDSGSTTLMGLSDSTNVRWAPTNRALSAAIGFVEMMEYMAEVSAKSNSEVTAQSHVWTMQNGVKIELAKDILPYQQQQQLGRELRGGWTTVRVGDFDIIDSPYHLHDVAYLLHPESLCVVDLDGDPNVFAGDGSEFSRLADYDGVEWYLRHYVQRFPIRRNNQGALTGISNPDAERYSAHPVS